MLPIVKAGEKNPIGVITDRDIVVRVLAAGLDPKNTKACFPLLPCRTLADLSLSQLVPGVECVLSGRLLSRRQGQHRLCGRLDVRDISVMHRFVSQRITVARCNKKIRRVLVGDKSKNELVRLPSLLMNSEREEYSSQVPSWACCPSTTCRQLMRVWPISPSGRRRRRLRKGCY
jgi:hypothetical protein